MEQQWSLLRPPTQASPAGVERPEPGSSARREAPGPRIAPARSETQRSDAIVLRKDATSDSGADASTERASSVTPKLDDDPERRERWLRDQLQIR